MRWVSLVALAVSGCLDVQLVTCPGDVVCPVGTLCDTAHGGCVTPDQAQACIGVADHEPCRAGSVIGYCLDQICIDPGCGNHVIDPGELCDDGNRVDGDGCSATCLSRERCGDGALDVQLGEECDDGNLQSHDGCDSRCLVETPMWTVEDIGPSRAEPHWTTFDPLLGKIVMVADGYVWAWDGVRWTVAGGGGPRIIDDYSVTFDVARGRLVLIAAAPQMGDIVIPNPARNQLYEWDGTSWTRTLITNAPGAASFVLTYDSVRSHVFGFGTTTGLAVLAGTFDAVTQTWTATTVPASFGTATEFAIAFDPSRGYVVAIGATAGGSVTAEWNGATWSTSAATTAAAGGWSAFYDPSITQVVVIGTKALASPTPAQSWNGTVWSNLTSVPGRLSRPSVGFDASRGARFVFGGGQSGIPDDVVEGSGASWTAMPRITPPPSVDACGFDELRQRFVCVGNATSIADTWAWGGSWTALSSASDIVSAVTYDPVRGAIVAITNGQMVVLGDTDWQSVGFTTQVQPAQAIAFDPSTHEIIASITEMFSGDTITLRVDEQGQTRSFTSMPLHSLAYDARNHTMVATGFNNTLELDNDTWTQVVGPGPGCTAVTNARRGTVEFVGPPHDVERVGSSWIDLEAPPMQLVGSTAFDQATGELFTLGVDGISRFLIHRRWHSATPFEDCTTSADADGDGLGGCDDPDCWSRCTPACPPLVSCI